jgi:hypothetical protein
MTASCGQTCMCANIRAVKSVVIGDLCDTVFMVRNLCYAEVELRVAEHLSVLCSNKSAVFIRR